MYKRELRMYVIQNISGFYHDHKRGDDNLGILDSQKREGHGLWTLSEELVYFHSLKPLHFQQIHCHERKGKSFKLYFNHISMLYACLNFPDISIAIHTKALIIIYGVCKPTSKIPIGQEHMP